MRWIAHVDMDSFYVSVERMKNPLLNGKPIVVGGLGPRAVVASASYEVRQKGVRSAMPMSQARRLYPEMIIVEPHFEWYSEISDRIFSALKNTAPKLEQVSVDEAYLDFTGCERLYENRELSARAVREAVRRESGLACTVCVATSKLVAKIGSDLAKPDGLLVVKPGTEETFLAPLSIRKIPGVGPKTAILFERRGIKTCADLVKADAHWLHREFGHYALELQESAQGLDDSEVSTEWERKSLGTEETFDVDVGSHEKLQQILRGMAEDVAFDLRSENFRAKTVQIKFRYSDFSTFTRARTLREPTSIACVLAETAIELLEENKNPHLPLRLLGISAKNLVSADGVGQNDQLDFFEKPQAREKSEKIENLKDELRRKFGRDVLVKPR